MITEADFQKLSDVIYRRVGIVLVDKKYSTMAPKIEAILKKHNYADFRSFFHDLRFEKNKSLTQDIINSITVNETYFFRENYQFNTLIKEVLPALHKQKPLKEPIRILCAPSSTGEEPYSIALCLLDEEKILNERDIELVGIDIDSTVIERAKMGFYMPRSVQFVPQNLLQKYFTSKNGGFEIAGFIKDAVNFQVCNVMDKIALKRLGKFDVIFCRNMLIYFDDNSRREVVLSFYEMLNNKGVIFLGHAESMSRIVSVFRIVKNEESIYYIKG